MNAGAGTENLSWYRGLAEALSDLPENPVFKTPAIEEGVLTCRRALGNMERLRWLSPEADVLANTLTFTLEGADSIGLLAALDLEGICASSGSACSVGSLEPSHVAWPWGAVGLRPMP